MNDNGGKAALTRTTCRLPALFYTGVFKSHLTASGRRSDLYAGKLYDCKTPDSMQGRSRYRKSVTVVLLSSRSEIHQHIL